MFDENDSDDLTVGDRLVEISRLAKCMALHIQKLEIETGSKFAMRLEDGETFSDWAGCSIVEMLDGEIAECSFGIALF
jgi:hypothetical protein